MGPDMASLMLKTMEGLLAKRALVGAGEVLPLLVLRALSVLE